MPGPSRIVVVEPSIATAEDIALHLRQDGLDVTVCRSAREALDELARATAALVVVDQVLPDATGTELLRSLRGQARHPGIPVILTGGSGEEVDRVVAFELGVDDYVPKPFSVRELALRVRAILRRIHPMRVVRGTDMIVIGPIEIDPGRHRTTVNGRSVPLTPLELRLLAHLATQPGRVHTREALLERVWRNAANEASRAVDTSIKRLRRKLGPAGTWIETVRGVGYRLRDTGPTRERSEKRCG